MNYMASISKELDALIESEYFGKRSSVSEFIDWTENCLRRAAELPSNKQYYSHRFLKKIRGEAYPISVFLRSALLEIMQIEPSNEEHTNFDAKFTLKDKTEFYAEVTFVKDGEFELFQGEHSDKFGYAGITGISKDEMKDAVNSGIPKIGDADDVSNTVRTSAEAIDKRIVAKIIKNYPTNTILLIAIEDDFRKHTFDAIFKSVHIPVQSTFRKIFLVSVNSKNCRQLH